jgi:hypothetical protein
MILLPLAIIHTHAPERSFVLHDDFFSFRGNDL